MTLRRPTTDYELDVIRHMPAENRALTVFRVTTINRL